MILLIIFIILAVVIILSTVRIVPQAYAYFIDSPDRASGLRLCGREAGCL